MRKIIDKIIEVMCTAIMGYMVLAVCWQVITRFVLKNPSTVTEETYTPNRGRTKAAGSTWLRVGNPHCLPTCRP